MTTLNSVSPAPGPAGSDLGSQSDSAPLSLDTRITHAFNGADSSEIAITLEQATAAIATAATDADRRVSARSIRWLLPVNSPLLALPWTMPNSCMNA